MAIPKGVRQIGWFVLLWGGGVGLILAISLAIRFALRL